MGLEWFFGGKALLKFFRVANFSGVEGMAAFNKVVTEFHGYILNDKAAACPMEVLQSSGRNLSGLFQEIKPSSGEEACGGGKPFQSGSMLPEGCLRCHALLREAPLDSCRRLPCHAKGTGDG